MTWQRIDENTYIDDTLVTCAEYQLFIDEMRQQGKYYQPDHWTSYQFPEGQSRNPVLGVRQSDVIAFCSWLTKYESGKWIFRLPTQSEAIVHSVIDGEIHPVGYWVSEKNQYLWVGIFPEDARKISIDIDQVYRDLARDLDLPFNLAKDFGKISIQAFKNNRQHFLNLDLVGPEYDPRVSKSNIEQIIDTILVDTWRHARDLERTLVVSLARDPTIIEAISLFVDLYALQERIAGRSPAFEGIRLAKERII